MIMLKDNHNDFAGGITAAITKTKAYLKENNLDLKIIVEARNLNEIKEILKNEGVFRILIDNFNYDDTRKAVAMIGTKCLTESSGNINETTIRSYAECGVNYISSGALTHSVYNMDLSLKAF
jgi:nicotinate-nucleotide pyrophosphorylase (carboxylating)